MTAKDSEASEGRRNRSTISRSETTTPATTIPRKRELTTSRVRKTRTSVVTAGSREVRP
jgi:hypothetical protein